MAFTTRVKDRINRALAGVNLRLDTLTARRAEDQRLAALLRAGHFSRPALPLPHAFEALAVEDILAAVAAYAPQIDRFADPGRNDVSYSFDNIYFTSPDAEVLYAMLRTHRPRTVIEVGSGHSTRIMRQAVIDGRLPTRVIAIDPQPRRDIAGMADVCHREAAGAGTDPALFAALQAGDFLFVDSSHEIRTGNDVVFLFLTVLPRLPAGVIVHVHDVFLPYDYPEEWVVRERWGFNEQYLVHGILAFGDAFDVLWAGHFLQRTLGGFSGHFPHLRQRVAQSLWLRKKG